MADNEKKKSKKSKAAFMFAFAATVLSSRAASLAASAAPVVDTDDISMPTVNNVQADIGTTVDYQKIASNVYIANESSPEMTSFGNVLSETRNYGVFAENFNMNNGGTHVEANVCAKNTRNVDAQYDNILAHSPDKATDAKLTWYLGAPPESTDIRLTVNSDKKYELVLGFPFEEISYDNGHGIGFKADGKEYHIECGGKAENVSIVRGDRNITSSLDNIAEQGNRLMLAADFESDNSDKSLFNAVSAILMDQVTRGQTLMVNVHANDLASNSGYIGNLLKCNKGVNVIINIMTDSSVKNIDLGRCSDDTWLETDGRVTFNFGTFNGTISTDKNAGTIVAPYASFVNRENFHGNVVAMSVDMGNELYQDLDNLTSTAPAVPPATPPSTPSTPNNEEQKPAEEQKPTEEQTSTEEQKTDEGNTDDTDDENKSDDEQLPDDETSDDNSGSDNTDSDDDDDDENTSEPSSGDDDETSDSSDPTDSDPLNDGEDDGTDSDADDVDDTTSDVDDGDDTTSDVDDVDDITSDVDDGDDTTSDVDDGDDTTSDVDDGDDTTSDVDDVDDTTSDVDNGDDTTSDVDDVDDTTSDVDDGDDTTSDVDDVDDTTSDVDDGDDTTSYVDNSDDTTSDVDESTEPETVDNGNDDGTDSDNDGIDNEPPSDEVTIEDNDVPLGDTPTNDSGVDNGTDEIDIFDDDVPLASNPDTGVEDSTGGLALGAAGAAIAMGVAAKLRKKK